MKFIVLCLGLIIFGCNSSSDNNITPQSTKPKPNLDQYFEEGGAAQNSLGAKDDFSDLKGSDKAECEKVEEKIKQIDHSKPASLQGGDTGCEVK